VLARREMWEQILQDIPVLVGKVDPQAHKKGNALCVYCGQLFTFGMLPRHEKSFECIARRNAFRAYEDGYVQYHRGYNAGTLSRSTWAQPFLKTYKSETGKERWDKPLMLVERYWARDWWLPIAYMTRDLSAPVRHLHMKNVLELYEAGDMDGIDALVGGIELAKAAL